MKYTILLCAFTLIALVGAVCIFCTRTILEKITKKNCEKEINHKVKIIKSIGWILLLIGLFLIYCINR